MKSVVVTGGSGKAGSAVIRELIEHGYAVMNVDVTPPAQPLCHFFKADLTDLGQAVEAVRRAAGTIDRRRSPLGNSQAIVHMAGIPAPSLAARRGDLPEQPDVDLQRVQRGDAVRPEAGRVGVQRDRLRPAADA